MAICNIFKKLTKETGEFLTFGQYMEDLTEWQTKSNYHRIVPSKFIAIDYKQNGYNNITLPKYIQDQFENACACFKNNVPPVVEDEIDSMAIGWSPEYSKTLFWNMMFGDSNLTDNEVDNEPISSGLITVNDIKYVGDINLQSYNTVDGMGYSEIYCHIPNEAAAYEYSYKKTKFANSFQISKTNKDIIEGFERDELSGWEILNLNENGHTYIIDGVYEFSWDDTTLHKKVLDDKKFNINMIIVLYDIWVNNKIVYQGIPMGLYLTGLFGDDGVLQNSITKYVCHEDIYNSGTSYGLRICSRYVASPVDDNYIVKEITCEDNGYSDISRVLSQLSISQNKMDEVINKTYNTEQNYKNLLSIFKNSRTNVPYIKIVNDESCWFVNGKLIGPSVVDGIYDAYTNNEIDTLMDINLNQNFQILASAKDINGKYLFDKFSDSSKDIIVNWDVYYEGQKIKPKNLYINEKLYTNTNQVIYSNIGETTKFVLEAEYGILKTTTTSVVHFLPPIYFGELYLDQDHGKILDPNTVNTDINVEKIKELPKYISTTASHTYELTTNQQNPGYVCYAYPILKNDDYNYSFGKMEYITDLFGYYYYSRYAVDGGNDFISVKDIIINEQPYRVYIQKELSIVQNQHYKFKTSNIE